VLDGFSNVALITLATDGEDGTTFAAGAVVTGESYQRCQQHGLDPVEYLQKHDSYEVFHQLDDLILTGPTGTNVNDLCFLFTF
jgi:hydroxypyruvate reductase